jgi:mRNA interferase MazF
MGKQPGSKNSWFYSQSEVKIKYKKINGVVLSDQVKSLDRKTGDAEFIIKASKEEIKEVIEKISVLILEE